VEPLLVFLVPLGGQRYELYCERQHVQGVEDAPAGSGWFAGVRQKFSAMLKQAEDQQDEALGRRRRAVGQQQGGDKRLQQDALARAGRPGEHRVRALPGQVHRHRT